MRCQFCQEILKVKSLLASEPIIKQHYQTVKTLFSGTDHWCFVDQDEVKRKNSLLLKTGGRLAQGSTTVRKRE